MITSHNTDVWPADEIETLDKFEESRALTVRATQLTLKTICNTYFKDATSILEIGSGTGFLARNIPKEYQERWIQLEAQQAFLEAAQQRHPLGQYINASAYDLPFKKNSQKAIIGYCSFDVLSNIDSAVKEVARVLCQTGTFIHLLDLGTNTDVIAKEFQQKRIPSFSKGETTSLLPGIGTKNMKFYYLPEHNRSKFLAEVNMTQQEMDALPEIDACFALLHYQKKYHSDTENIESMMDYLKLFEKYAQILDEQAHFHTSLITALKEHFNPKQVQYKTITTNWQGQRTPQQIKKHKDAYTYIRNKGTIKSGILTHQLPQYHLHQLLQNKFPKIASYIEPSCTEISTLECVIATKE